MTYTPPTVNYSTTINGTYTTLSGIQSVSVSRGRQRFQDNIGATSCTIELIPATSYATPLAVGQFIDVRTSNTGSSTAYFCGKITDIQRTYSYPYNSVSGYAPADRIVITATGATGLLAATTLDNYSFASIYASVALSTMISTYGVVPIYVDSFTQSSIQTYSGGLFDAANQLLRTLQYVLEETRTDRTNPYFFITFGPLGYGWSTPTKFSDTGASGSLAFTELQFLSSAQNSFTQVSVQPEGLAAQTVSTGSAPYNSLPYQTYNNSTADALSLANYILTTNNQPTPVPFTLSTNTMAAPTCMSLAEWVDPSGPMAPILGSPVEVTFRGSTSVASIQGITSVFYPDHASVQLFLSPSLGTPFTLDSTAFGVLDTNRLGYP